MEGVSEPGPSVCLRRQTSFKRTRPGPVLPETGAAAAGSGLVVGVSVPKHGEEKLADSRRAHRVRECASNPLKAYLRVLGSNCDPVSWTLLRPVARDKGVGDLVPHYHAEKDAAAVPHVRTHTTSASQMWSLHPIPWLELSCRRVGEADIPWLGRECRFSRAKKQELLKQSPSLVRLA